MKLSKTIALGLALCFATLQATAQKPVQVKKGDLELSAGIGLLPTFAADRGKTIVPPLSARLTYHVGNNFSLGAYAAYSTTQTNKIARGNGAVETYENQFTLIGLRAAGHCVRFDNWDIYGGLMVGYNIPNVTMLSSSNPSESPRDDIQPSFTRPATNNMTFSGFVGASYFLNQKFGAFGEVGYGISLLNVGVTYRL